MMKYVIKQCDERKLNKPHFISCICVQKVPITTTDDTPIFDRNRVALDVPSRAFGAGFTLITNISKILNSIILVSIAHMLIKIHLVKYTIMVSVDTEI